MNLYFNFKRLTFSLSRLNREATSDRISLGLILTLLIIFLLIGIFKNHKGVANCCPIQDLKCLELATNIFVRNHNSVDNDLPWTWSQERLTKGMTMMTLLLLIIIIIMLIIVINTRSITRQPLTTLSSSPSPTYFQLWFRWKWFFFIFVWKLKY